MKYALITDNCTQWFSYIVSIFDTGETVETYEVPSKLTNEFLLNLYKREQSFSGLNIRIPNEPASFCWAGSWISGYEFQRVKKMIQLWPAVQEFERLGKLEKI